MPHHEETQSSDEQKKLVQRFLDQAHGIAQRAYPNGRLGPNDDGLGTYAMAYDPTYKVIRVQFPTPTLWLALDLESATQLRDALGAKLKEMEEHLKCNT